MDPEAQRIRDYLVAQAATKDVAALVERVRDGVADLERAARTIPPERYGETATGETWTPADCLGHAAGSNMGIATQILHAAWTGDPSGEEADIAGERDDLLSRHAEAMESLYVHVLEADPAANLETRWEHPMFGPLNWREWLLFLRIHSKDHAGQLQAMGETLA